MMDRYFAPEAVARERLDGLPSLVKLAWDIALLFPEMGDEIIADLRSDVETIVAREATRLAAEAQMSAEAAAREQWREEVFRAYRRSARELAGVAAASRTEGICPHGWYVYLLWPAKDAEKPIYVGRSENLLSRLGSHMADHEKRYGTAWISFIECDEEDIMMQTESKLISYYQPELNTIGVGIRS